MALLVISSEFKPKSLREKTLYINNPQPTSIPKPKNQNEIIPRTQQKSSTLVYFRIQKQTTKQKGIMSLLTEELKAKADEVYYGDKISQEKTRLLLKEVGLPNGLLPLKDIIECGYVKETGFVWMKQKKAITHKFDKIGKQVSYAKEVTANVEKNKVKNLTGVKAKEVLIWLTLSEIYVDDPPTGNITFKIPTGLSRAYPVDAFEVEEEEETAKEKKEVREVSNGGSVVVNVKEV